MYIDNRFNRDGSGHIIVGIIGGSVRGLHHGQLCFLNNIFDSLASLMFLSICAYDPEPRNKDYMTTIIILFLNIIKALLPIKMNLFNILYTNAEKNARVIIS
jgi:hypothetical protein